MSTTALKKQLEATQKAMSMLAEKFVEKEQMFPLDLESTVFCISATKEVEIVHVDEDNYFTLVHGLEQGTVFKTESGAEMNLFIESVEN